MSEFARTVTVASLEDRRPSRVLVGETAIAVVSIDGEIFAGTHLIIDLWDARDLDCLERMETAMRTCVEECAATLLHIHLHHFTPNGGISGVAVLAESHISVHTWPEKNYAAFDVFMCGDSNPHRAIEILSRYFRPGRVEVVEERRGKVS